MIKYDIALDYESRSLIWHGSEPEDYLLEVRIKVIGLSDSPKRTEIVLGEGLATQVHIGRAINNKKDLFYIFDTDQELTDAGRATFNSEFTDFKPSVRKQHPDAFSWDDFLLIRQLTLLPQFRGRELGLTAMHRIVKDLGHGCGLTVLKPYPLGETGSPLIVARVEPYPQLFQGNLARRSPMPHQSVIPAKTSPSAAAC